MKRDAVWRWGAMALVGLLFVAARVLGEEGPGIDWNKAKAARQAGGGTPPQTGKESVGLVPLTDMKEGQTYKEMDGGLYGAGRNEPPEDQAKRAQAAAAQVAPLNAEGKPAADGKIVLMSIGMSNTTQAFSRFKQLAESDAEKSPSLVIVDSAQGAKDAAAWVAGADPTRNPVWAEADRRLAAAGVTPRQVQVVWLKQALMGPARRGEFPAHAKELATDIAAILALAKAHYPNLRLAYLSSRIYAGYAGTPLNPEPYAYESAFSVRWVIEDQIKGDPKLNCDPARGEVKAPVVLWGPYLWADGVKGRQAGDLVWRREDLAGDGTHASQSGRQKVGELLLRFFKTDPYAKGWFLKGDGRM